MFSDQSSSEGNIEGGGVTLFPCSTIVLSQKCNARVHQTSGTIGLWLKICTSVGERTSVGYWPAEMKNDGEIAKTFLTIPK